MNSPAQAEPHDLLSSSGSYQAEDVTFLLQSLSLAPTSVLEKEKLIQSGTKHYSEMIGTENPPTPAHQQLYRDALIDGAARMGREVQALALALAEYHAEMTHQGSMFATAPLVLVSFVRAGVPLGVLLKHALTELDVPCIHYGVSIIRDKGIDQNALEFIIAKHGHQGIVFVDGWTGKGAITRELMACLKDDPRFPARLPLVTLADTGGYAWLTASPDDWLIPSGILGATVSGLISRTILTNEGWHGCIEYQHLAPFDQSNDFIQRIDQARHEQQKRIEIKPARWTAQQSETQQQAASAVIDWISQEWKITNPNRVKPGIAEATRAILRRVPELVLLRDADDADTKLLRHLSEQAGAPIRVVGERLGPYRAVTLIQKLGS